MVFKETTIVTLSSCESEYIVATLCTCLAIWLKKQLKELNFEQKKATKIMIDNKLVFHH